MGKPLWQECDGVGHITSVVSKQEDVNDDAQLGESRVPESQSNGRGTIKTLEGSSLMGEGHPFLKGEESRSGERALTLSWVRCSLVWETGGPYSPRMKSYYFGAVVKLTQRPATLELCRRPLGC